MIVADEISYTNILQEYILGSALSSFISDIFYYEVGHGLCVLDIEISCRKFSKTMFIAKVVKSTEINKLGGGLNLRAMLNSRVRMRKKRTIWDFE